VIDREDLQGFVEEAVAKASHSGGWWRRPLLATAEIDDRFLALPKIAAKDHILPRDLLPTARSLIVFFIPFKESLIRENSQGERPCRNWGLSYVETNRLIGDISKGIADLLASEGFGSALTPATHNFDEERLMARWSHKHLAFLSGLGRFGLHNLIITPMGCAGRLGSLVTEARLGETPLIETSEACLAKAGRQCGKCLSACPVAALKKDGIERRLCWDRLKENRATLSHFSDLPESTHVCGKCAAMMPCSFKNPVMSLKNEEGIGGHA
jgi:epoxyqueuosine reductase QueG